MILVTGATGKTGAPLVRTLVQARQPVAALVRDPVRARELLGDGVELVTGDLGDAGSVERAVAGVERVYLLTPPHPQQGEWERGVIEAARDAGVRHVVKHSLMGADAGSRMSAARTHAEIEDALAASGLGWTVLRPNFFFQTFAGGMVVQGSMYTAAGEGRISGVDTRDVAAAAVAVLTGDGHEGRTYTLTGPEAFTFAEAAAAIGEETGRPVQHVDVPADALAAGMAQAGVPDWLAQDVAALQQEYADGVGAEVTEDVRELTGQEPRSLRDFVRENADAF
jgi:uncharacterized protein YbjT (DUF2867 family)